MKQIDLRKMATDLVVTIHNEGSPEELTEVVVEGGHPTVGYLDPDIAEEVVARHNGYLDLVAAADNLCVVVEDCCGESMQGIASVLRDLLEDQGWDKDSLSKLLDARDGNAEHTYWVANVDGKWGVWDKSPMTKGAKLLVPATNQEDAENKRNALERFKLEPVATAQPELLPFTVVVQYMKEVWTLYPSATTPALAAKNAVDSLVLERYGEVEPEVHARFEKQYEVHAIYAGHLTNLIQ